MNSPQVSRMILQQLIQDAIEYLAFGRLQITVEEERNGCVIGSAGEVTGANRRNDGGRVWGWGGLDNRAAKIWVGRQGGRG